MSFRDFIIADNPIISRDYDRFGRSKFAAGIARTIDKETNPHSLVIGVYGKWGEGKSSIFNLMEGYLEEEGHIVVNFNPWRYGEQSALLQSYFQTLADALDKSLHKPRERIGKLLEQYAGILAPLNLSVGTAISGSPSGWLKNLGERLSNVELDTLKERIEDILLEENRRIVIFIDDIDRLEVREIYSVFKLIKLTADFANTAYVLAFDPIQVSAALTHYYSQPSDNFGESFLGKIIQYPLELPPVSQTMIKNYFLDVLDNILRAAAIEVEEREIKSFINDFIAYILMKVRSPRQAIRYGNNLFFAINLLQDSVHLGDLMRTEALKIFYPQTIRFVRQHPWIFLAPKNSRFLTHGDSQRKINAASTALGGHLEQYAPREAQAVKSLLVSLFPLLNELYGNYSYDSLMLTKWENGRRVASTSYFDFYINYHLSLNDIPATAFSTFLDTASYSYSSYLEEEIKHLIGLYSADTFLTKMKVELHLLDAHISENIAEAICRLDSCFPDEEVNFQNPFMEAASVISGLVRNIPKGNPRQDLALKVLQKSGSLRFAAYVLLKLLPSFDVDDAYWEFTYTELQQIWKTFALRQKNEPHSLEGEGEALLGQFQKWKDYLGSPAED